MPGEASRARKTAAAKAGADLRGEVLLALARLRLATPPSAQGAAAALPAGHRPRPPRAARPARRIPGPGRPDSPRPAELLVLHPGRPAGLAEASASASGELASPVGRTTGKRIAAGKTGLREHGLALVDTVIAFHRAQVADHAGWRGEVAHPTPAGSLVPDGVVLLDDGTSAFVEIDRAMSYARLIDELERYDVYRSAPASGRGNAARAPRSHWQEVYVGPSLERPFPPVLFVFVPAPRRAAPATREAAFHEWARRVGSMNHRLTVATTTLPLLTSSGAGQQVWRGLPGLHTDPGKPLRPPPGLPTAPCASPGQDGQVLLRTPVTGRDGCHQARPTTCAFAPPWSRRLSPARRGCCHLPHSPSL
ncbi:MULTISPECIES: replication-relaxation family protein [unclassified Streptomyces]|uniref:replication-relaxation family protein n=1 Tax=unclassified Streptomyces TaxID=2593676 RepID=UPI0035E2C966